MLILDVVQCEYIDDYRLRLTFNDSTVREVDLRDELKGEVFEPLRDIEFFKHVVVHHGTIEWPNGADFAPEFLYEIGEAVEMVPTI